MTVIEALILGVTQGVTEFLPISSSGHLILLEQWLGLDVNSITFDVAVHMATLLAILWVMRKDLMELLAQLAHTPWHRTLAFKLIVATIPVGMIGVLLSGETIMALRTSWVVAVSLIVWGVVLWWMDKIKTEQKGEQNRSVNATWYQAIFIGLMQMVALIPGTSRSGITMIAGLGTKMSRVQAARFSFLLSIPALAGAGLVTFFDVQKTGLDIAWVPLLVGFAAAFVAGLVSAQFLLSFLTSKGFRPFAVYRILLGLFVMLFVVF